MEQSLGAPSREGAGSAGSRLSEGSKEEQPPREDLGRPCSAGRGGGWQREHAQSSHRPDGDPSPCGLAAPG